MWESEILPLGDGTILVECGPMRMFIEASANRILRQDLCRDAALKAIGFLEEVAAFKSSLRAPAVQIDEASLSSVPRTMWEAARLVGDEDLTPMAAVAGTIADATADWLADQAMTRVVVNNGGDVALRLKGDEALYVGIRPDVECTEVSHRVLVTPDMQIGGVATSGLGGRSFTRGVASSATVFASTSAIADAAATSVANATNLRSPAVERRLADSLYPDTDLRGVEVTYAVGDLSDAEVESALNQGAARADELVTRGMIVGACLFVKGRMRSTRELTRIIESLGS